MAKELRALTVNSASTKLTRLYVTLKRNGLSTDVEDFERYLSPEYDAHWLINKTIRVKEVIPQMRLAEVRYLCHGSPTLSEFLKHVDVELLSGKRTQIIPKNC